MYKGSDDIYVSVALNITYRKSKPCGDFIIICKKKYIILFLFLNEQDKNNETLLFHMNYIMQYD